VYGVTGIEVETVTRNRRENCRRSRYLSKDVADSKFSAEENSFGARCG
jgi:hypothetical protein